MATTEIKRAGSPASTVIEDSETTSGAIPITGFSLFGLFFDSDFDGIGLTFQVSYDDVTYQPLYSADDGNPVSIFAGASRGVALPPELAPFNYVKFVADAQTNDTTLVVIRKG